MKKITGLLCCFAMLFSMAACSSKPSEDDTLDKLDKGFQNMSKMKSANYEASLKQEADETSTFKLHGSYLTEKDKQPEFSAVLDVEASGQTQEGFMQFYSDGEQLYMNFMEYSKTKTPVSSSVDGLVTSAKKNKSVFKKSNLKKMMKDIKMEDDVITLNFDDKKAMKEMKNILSTSGQSSLTSTFDDVTFKTLKLVVTLKDDMVTKIKLVADMKNETAEVKNAKMTISLSFNNINKVKNIDYPDFSDYIESEGSSNTLPFLNNM